jgi:hypothetical protein
MQTRFVAAQKEDFRAAMVTNLRQVLAGTLKPKKRSQTPTATTRRRPTKNSRRRKAA